MPRTAAEKNSAVSRLALVGGGSGRIKLLSGFQKRIHREPDSASDAAQAFLGKVCTRELEEEAEALFQSARASLGYKRREISLSVSSPVALLQAKDFSFELVYSLTEDDPTHYTISRKLHQIQGLDLLATDELNAVFAGMFSTISFALRKAVAVEQVIDAIEALDEPAPLEVSYPSDCGYCTVTVDDVPARVEYHGRTLEMHFDQQGSPRELLETFEQVRHAFSMTGDDTLLALCEA